MRTTQDRVASLIKLNEGKGRGESRTTQVGAQGPPRMARYDEPWVSAISKCSAVSGQGVSRMESGESISRFG